MDLRDVQVERPDVVRYIDKVGVRNVPVMLPVTVISTINVCSTASLYTNLNNSVKGTHMSRLVQVCLKGASKKNLSGFLVVHDCLVALKERLGADNTYVKFRFPLLVPRRAPVSDHSGYVRLDCVLEGSIVEGKFNYFIEVEFPYMSLCPCSKSISVSGAAHNQRSTARLRLAINRVFAEVGDNPAYEDLSFVLYALLAVVSDAASSDVYPVVKRVDEKYIVDDAYRSPAFVEDTARAIASSIVDEKAGKLWMVDNYVVVVNHFESIHQHDAVAVVRGGLV